MHHLIHTEKTGTPVKFATKLKLSRSQLYPKRSRNCQRIIFNNLLAIVVFVDKTVIDAGNVFREFVYQPI